jgi:hypothetical protein
MPGCSTATTSFAATSGSSAVILLAAPTVL